VLSNALGVEELEKKELKSSFRGYANECSWTSGTNIATLQLLEYRGAGQAVLRPKRSSLTARSAGIHSVGDILGAGKARLTN